MKSLLLAATVLLSMNAMADQCQGITRAEADRAALLLQKNATIIKYCEPCLDFPGAKKTSTTTVVNTVKIENLGSYSTVNVNGKSIDLAYAFLKVSPDRAVNLAKIVNCESLDESTVSSVIDADLNTIKR